MNWLAHAFLSPADDQTRLGNLLADVINGRDRKRLSADFQRGIHLHQQIDLFTDSHPIVHQSRTRIAAEHRRFAGILVDIFYDHFLARRWDEFSHEPLEAFTSRLHAAIAAHRHALPPDARELADMIAREDLLATYRRIEGIEAVIVRLSRRLEQRFEREIELHEAAGELRANYDGLGDDFSRFFPELQLHVSQRNMEPQMNTDKHR